MFKRWTSHFVNLVSCGIYISVLVIGFLFDNAIVLDQMRLWLISLTLLAMFAFAFNLWRYLAIASAPVSTIAAAAQGYIELNGIASKEHPIKTPLHGEPCVWFRSWAYAQDYKNLWRLVDYTQSIESFQLEDHSGVCMVNPYGAEVVHMLKKTSFKNNHRYVEEYLPADKALYLIGHLDTRHHFFSEAVVRQDIWDLIADWKLNSTKMLFRFDLDRNGEIDQEEWEAARKEARQEITRKHLYKAHMGNFEISAPTNGQLYLLSGMSPELLRSSYRCWVMTHLAVLIGLLVTIGLLY